MLYILFLVPFVPFVSRSLSRKFFGAKPCIHAGFSVFLALVPLVPLEKGILARVKIIIF